MRKLCSIIFLIIVLHCGNALSAPQELNIEKISAANASTLFDFYGFPSYLPLPNYEIPPIFLKTLPTGYNDITDEKERNSLFIRILAPLAFKVNQEIMDERKIIETVSEHFEAGTPLTEKELKIIEEKAEKYDIFSRLKDRERHAYLISELLNRIGEIPPSFLIAVATVETNWGTSRIVREGNALYKELVWHTDQGLKPIGEIEDDTYRIQTFPSLYAAMQNYALKLNSKNTFSHMRYMRRQLLYFNQPLKGTTYVYTLIWNSPLKNYAGLLEYTIAFYELNIIDKSHLNAKMLDKKQTPEISAILAKDKKL